MQKIGQI